MTEDKDRDRILEVFRNSNGQTQGRSSRTKFVDLCSSSFEHPLDRAALDRLRQIPMLAPVLKAVFGTISERSLHLLHLAHCVRVGPKQFPMLHEILLESCDILDMSAVPELFVAQTPIVNAGAMGMKTPFIVINSGSLELFSPDELRFVIGHELGHILSGHVLYKTLLKSALSLTLPMFARIGLPIAGIALHGLVAALMEWDRKSEYSADRAGLLCSQNPQDSYTCLMRLAGGRYDGQLNLDAFIAQAEEYESSGDKKDAALKVLNLLGRSHPFPVLRLAQLKNWVEQGHYESIIQGEYNRRNRDSIEDPDDGVSTESPREAETHEDPLFDLFRSMGERMSDAGQLIRSQLADFVHSKTAKSESDSDHS